MWTDVIVDIIPPFDSPPPLASLNMYSPDLKLRVLLFGYRRRHHKNQKFHPEKGDDLSSRSCYTRYEPARENTQFCQIVFIMLT